MKKVFSLIMLSLGSITAFAQGKVSFQTDTLHLAYWPFDYGLAIAGKPIGIDNLPGGISGMAADLYMGTSSSLLYLYASTTFGAASADGKWPSVAVQANANAITGAPGIPGGTSVFVEIAVRSTERAAPNIFTGDGSQYFAYFTSAEFTFTLGSGITYPVLWSQTSGNWPIGQFNMDNSIYGPGARGAIPYIPEPSALAFAGMAAAMLIFRRRQYFNQRTFQEAVRKNGFVFVPFEHASVIVPNHE